MGGVGMAEIGRLGTEDNTAGSIKASRGLGLYPPSTDKATEAQRARETFPP